MTDPAIPALPAKPRMLLDHISYNSSIIEDAIDSYARAAILADRAAGRASRVQGEAVAEIVGTEKRGFALMTIVNWDPGFNRTKIGTKLYSTPQADGVREKAWTLTAPDGRQWHADSALKCAAAEQRERIPAKVALDRIFADVDAFEAEERAKIAGELERHAISARVCPPDSQVVTLYSIKRLLTLKEAQ